MSEDVRSLCGGGGEEGCSEAVEGKVFSSGVGQYSSDGAVGTAVIVEILFRGEKLISYPLLGIRDCDNDLPR